MMTLYLSPGACSLASHIALNAASLPYRAVRVDLKEKRTADGADFTVVNPKGYVPALELDDGEVLTENIAVLSFIARSAGTLMPAAGMPHWRVLETTAFISTELHKNFKPFFDKSASDDARTKAGEVIGQRLRLMEARLGDRAFIVGEELSIADCYLFVVLRWAGRLGLPLPEHLDAYYQRMTQLPAVADALKDEGIDG